MTMKFVLPDLAGFEKIKIHAVESYADSLFTYEECFDKARARQLSEEEINDILPEAKPTPGEFIYDIFVDDKHVGYIWYHLAFTEPAAFALKAPKCSSFLTYIHIHENYRRQGLGLQAMQLYEDKIRKSGAYETKHYVFIGNTAGVKMYKKMGYKIEREVNLYEAKKPSRFFMRKLFPSS